MSYDKDLGKKITQQEQEQIDKYLYDLDKLVQEQAKANASLFNTIQQINIQYGIKRETKPKKYGWSKISKR